MPWWLKRWEKYDTKTGENVSICIYLKDAHLNNRPLETNILKNGKKFF